MNKPLPTYQEACFIQRQIGDLNFPEDLTLSQIQTTELEIKQLEAQYAALTNWKERHAIVKKGFVYSGENYEYKVITIFRAIKILIEGLAKGYCSFKIFQKTSKEKSS